MQHNSRRITNDERHFFDKHGYLILRDLLSPEEISDLQRWAQEVHDWPTDDTSPWMPYAEINARGNQVLCRTENYAGSHAGFGALLRGDKILAILRDLAGEEMILFKEKINYKLAGSGGFAPHLDSTAYTHVKKIHHLSILLAVDPSNMSNGGLEVVPGSHRLEIPLNKNNCIESSWVDDQDWLPVELEAGEALVFGSYLAHRSGPNQSTEDRKALYATYNRRSEGDLHDAYYARRKIEFPPTHLRRKGEKFDMGSLRYGFGSPMQSVEVGHQLIF